MDTRQFYHFVCVAENANISKAARMLSITQPALSRSICRLEEALGVKLFYRGQNGLELTDAGRVFLARAREFIELDHNTRREMGDLKREQAYIRIILRCVEIFLPDLLRQFRVRHPEVCFSVLQNDDIALQNYRCDLIISGELADETGFARTRLVSERCLCALSREYAAGRSKISRDEFLALPWIQFGGHRQIQRFIKEQLQRYGLVRSPQTICDDVHMGCRLVAAEMGCLLVPEYAVDGEVRSKVSLVEIDGVNITRDVYLYRRANLHLSEYAQKFCRFVTSYFRQYEQAGRRGKTPGGPAEEDV